MPSRRTPLIGLLVAVALLSESIALLARDADPARGDPDPAVDEDARPGTPE